MKYLIYLSAIIFFSACNSESKETQQAVIATPTGLEGLQKSPTAAQATQNTGKALIFNPPHGEAGHNCALAVGAPLNQSAAAQPQPSVTPAQTAQVNVTAPTNTTGQKLNPEHGKPGHRCDLAVGAPLNSKPTEVVQAPAAQPVVTQVATSKVAKGMNPAHGEPNHRCDIAVGAPLNSKPTQAATVTPTATPLVVPAENKIPFTQTGTKLNPKHGEPGHRCDIAVGAPLT